MTFTMTSCTCIDIRHDHESGKCQRPSIYNGSSCRDCHDWAGYTMPKQKTNYNIVNEDEGDEAPD